jgi:ABC-2 type transport system ATP-binding protein
MTGRSTVSFFPERAMPTTIIEIRDLVKQFGSTRRRDGDENGQKGLSKGVNGISLDVMEGEALGLLGPNGAGKTTTINLIIGVLRPGGGTVSILGESPGNASTRRSIGLAPQSLSLYEDLTARENLAFFGKLYGLPASELRERVRWALEFAGLADRAGDYVKTFSGGMKRRLNLACALVHDPKVVLLDEPTVGVDPQSRNHLFDCIEQLKQDGLTVLYTTHYMEEAQRLCDRVAIIDHGQLLALDTVEGLLNQHGGQSLVVGRLVRPAADDVTLPGELVELDWRYQADDPMQAITAAARSGVDFQSLAITRPDMESVFLNLTGRSLRD